MNDVTTTALLVTNLTVLIAILILILRTRDRRKIEIKYFEYTDELSGALRDTKRVMVKGQVHVDGIPIGGQFVVAETAIEKFNYEKLSKFRDEVVKPLAMFGFNTLGPGRSLSVGTSVLKLLTRR